MSANDTQGEQIGKFQVITRLSVGGMAELFLGFTAGPGGFRKYVALKRILPDVRTNEQFVRMFLDEARITAAFNHPNIAQVYELGEEDDGLYLAMEFISGQDLERVASAHRRRGERVPLGMSLSVMRDVCHALHYAHTFTDPSGRASPIIHRDVAQKNIMVTYDGVVKLLDFGIAKARNSLERTRVGTVKGTAGYMSPEQVRGLPLDGRSDVFSVGVVLWELVTGERLFAAENEREEMKKILDAPIVSPRQKTPGVSEELASVILRALERNPGTRWPNAKELARALEQVGGELLFDSDQRAALMRGLFEHKMQTTRALLEMADPRQSGELAALPWQPDAEPDAPAPRPATQVLEERDTAPESVAQWDTAPRAPVVAPASEKKTRVRKKLMSEPDAGAKKNLGLAGLAAGKTQVSAQAIEDVSDNKKLNAVLMVLVVLGIGLGVGFMVINERQGQAAGPPPPEPSGPLQAFTPQLRVFPEPGQPPATESATADGGVPEGGPAVATGRPGAGEEPRADGKEPEEKSGKARVAQGKMTLIINPEAEVLLGKKSLGKTPLFNTPLPVGTHLLRIVGADGKRRKLSVPIKKGETTMLRLGLNDIPVGR
ncbi:MAG TPA: serine/threonine-protein kinase [Myxococcaceae bacterium]|nr:serine/threonine-protein kinase [Myxococcaceae bacterium]